MNKNQSYHCQPVQSAFTVPYDNKKNLEQNDYFSVDTDHQLTTLYDQLQTIEDKNNNDEKVDNDLSDASDKGNSNQSIKTMGPIISTEGINDYFFD